MSTYNVLESKTLLEDILDILGIDIHLSLVLKENLPKVYFRFDEHFSSLIFQLFNYYKLACNIFENAILLKRTPEYFDQDMSFHFKSFINLEKQFEEMFEDKKTFRLLKELSLFLTMTQYKELIDIVDKSYKNGDRKVFIIDGKDKLLSVYLSIITLIHGLKQIQKNNHYIFYYQPFYNKVKGFFKFVADKSVELLDKSIILMLSYRYCDRDYTIFDEECKSERADIDSIIKMVNYFDTAYISFFENSNLSMNDFPEHIKNKIHFDDTGVKLFFEVGY